MLVFSAWIVIDVVLVGVSGGLAQTTYDNMVRGRVITAPADPRIVIIDIDESALARMATEFGRWPWPRDTLASVLDYVEDQQPAAVVWDIIFSDVDRLNPGGDAAFDAAAKRSTHSHFGLVRLPKTNDDKSELTQKNLPSLWVQTAPPESKELSTVALIPPVLPGVAVKPLGYNNGYVDRDGILRRYRYFERLDDGGMIQSLPMSVVQQVDPKAHAFWLERFLNKPQTIASDNATQDDVLINWRKKANVYPRVNFADVFALADGGKPKEEVPSFAGKIVIIGSTAPSLHDIHPTPLSSTQAGVESLATGIDNALNLRVMREMPKWLGALIAIVMCVGLAFWSFHKNVSSLAAGMLGMPSVMLGISFVSVSAWRLKDPWTDQQLQNMTRVMREHAANCRILLLDTSTPSQRRMIRWSPFANLLALVGPEVELENARREFEKTFPHLEVKVGRILALEIQNEVTPPQIAQLVLQAFTEASPEKIPHLKN